MTNQSENIELQSADFKKNGNLTVYIYNASSKGKKNLQFCSCYAKNYCKVEIFDKKILEMEGES